MIPLLILLFAVAVNNGEIDDNSNTARMILCGIPLDESYLQYRLSILIKEEMKGLRRGKLYVPDCYYLMGTADPTGILEKDEVCIILYVLFLAHFPPQLCQIMQEFDSIFEIDVSSNGVTLTCIVYDFRNCIISVNLLLIHVFFLDYLSYVSFVHLCRVLSC